MRELLFKIAYRAGVHRFIKKATAKNGNTMLCLHRVNPITDALLPALHPDVFKKLIRLLKRSYAIVGLAELSSPDFQITSNKPCLTITFDDGYKDFIDYAMPVIAEEKITVNHNVVVHCADSGELIWTQRLNNLLRSLQLNAVPFNIKFQDFDFQPEPSWSALQIKRALFKKLFKKPYSFITALVNFLEKQYSYSQPPNEMMNWQEIISCANDGVEIGSHTFYHSSLEIETDDEFLQKEITSSKSVIENKINRKVNTIAYPNGLLHKKAYEIAVAAGYTNHLLIEGIDYDSIIQQNSPVLHFARRLVGGHPYVYENVFNVAGFHKQLHL